ncbi:MAG: hypothetical protein Q9219_007573 [cf. Caloplaca sp. 3 TL-2023]
MYGAGFKNRTQVLNLGSQSRPQNKGEQEKNIWSSLLNGVASSKKLPEKNLLVLGGDSELQREFLETLETESSRRTPDRRRKKPPIANDIALGYTYQDVLDADHDDILARLSIYLLSESSPTFSALVKPLLTPKTIPEILVVILLDWADPWTWARQLRDWIRFLKGIIEGADDHCKIAAEETIKEWQQRRRGATYEGASAAAGDPGITIPLGQGEWDEPLGLPICVACHGTEKIEALEKDHGWREEEFDFALQYLRTVLLKHGASLIHTSLSAPNSLPTLIHSSLGIHSLLKRQTLKHNVIDRDKVLVPPNWDSWGKIRVLREGFDVEGISSGWSIDTQIPPHFQKNQQPQSEEEEKEKGAQPPNSQATTPAPLPNSQNATTHHPTHQPPSPFLPGSTLQTYSSTLPNPYKDHPSTIPPIGATIPLDTTAPSMQEFLRSAQDQMAKIAEAEAASTTTTSSQPPLPHTTSTSTPTNKTTDTSQKVTQHIGPIQFNMGGIQVDAEEMVRKLKEKGGKEGDGGEGGEYGPGTPEGTRKQNEELALFFQGLLEKGRKVGGSGSPRVGSGGGGGGGGGGGSGGTPSKMGPGGGAGGGK